MVELAPMSDASEYRFIDEHDQIRTIRVLGHKMLVRKCLADSSGVLIDAPATFDGRAQLPAHLQHEVKHLLGSLQERTNCCEVMAVGPRCNCSRSDGDFRRLNPKQSGGKPVYKRPVPRCMVNPSRPGDFVYLPEQSERGLMWNDALGIGRLDYVLIDESECMAIVPKELAHE
jgi:hypothetical protein